MNAKKILSIIFAILCFGTTSYSQSSVCPPNIDFEMGDLSGWSYYTGSCCPLVISTTAVPPIACRHTLTQASGLVGCTSSPTPGFPPMARDEYGNFPIVAPGGGTYSLKLGNKSVSRQAERARFYVPIPAGADNYSLIYRYAVVLQNPAGHSDDGQPRFEVNVYDSATLTDIPCSHYVYVADASLPGFMFSGCDTCAPRSSTGTPVYYKDWTTSSINLSGLAGTTVGIDFTSGDCDLGGHFGYGYLDMSCGLFAISSVICDTMTPPTLTAPAGFATYEWYDSATFSVFYGTGETITVPFPSSPITLAVILTPLVGFGCPDTLYTTIRPANMALHPSNDTAICLGQSTMLEPNATDVALPLTYSWSPASGLSCTNCPNPLASPTVNTVYTVVVTNTNGCTMEHEFRVDILPNLITNISVDTPTCHGYNDGSAWVTVATGTAPYTYVWSTTPVQTTSLATSLGTGTYTVIVTDNNGCKDTTSDFILDPDERIIAVETFADPSMCLAANGSITLSGLLIPDTTYTVTYQKDGTPITTTIVANSAGRVVITGLTAGTYTNITIIGATCNYNVVGPVFLSDPPIPDLTGVTSNSFVCVGETLKLFASSTTAGVTFSWVGPSGFTSALQNPEIVPAIMANAGVYSVTASKANCFNYASTVVEIRPLPEPVATSNTPVCSNDTLFLMSESASGATSYEWNGPDYYNSFAQNPYIAHVQTVSTGTYTVAMTLNGCTVSDTVQVIVNQTPDAPIVVDTNYCQNDIAVTYDVTGDNLMWYTSEFDFTGTSTAATPPTDKPGIYSMYVTQTSIEGCTSERAKVTARVWTFPNPHLSFTDSVSCSGKYITFTDENIGEGSSGLTWQFGTGEDIFKDTNPIKHAFNTAGTFTVTATAEYVYCPTATLEQEINIFPAPTMDLGGDTTICPGSASIMLSAKRINAAGGVPAWEWSTGEKSPYITIVAPGTYHATITVNGCSHTDSIEVVKDCYINVPNVFTPNGDGVNDYFFPRQLLSSGLIDFNMNIFNRWGQLIFTANSLQGRGWDGKLNEIPQPEGVYVYQIDAIFKDGQHESHKGNVTLLR